MAFSRGCSGYFVHLFVKQASLLKNSSMHESKPDKAYAQLQ